MKSFQYRPDIDGLRALAVVPVLLFHAKLGCSGGFVGVDVFFVISGFLISTLILKELDEGTFNVVSFWERRIRRILPALSLVILSTIVAGWLLFVPEEFERLGKSVVAQVVLASNFLFYRQGLVGNGYFAPASETKPLLHTWSLAVEEQFYLFFPLLLGLLVIRQFRSPALIIGTLAIGSFAASAIGAHVYPEATFYLLPTRAWELFLGAWLATTTGHFSAGIRLREAAGWLGAVLIGCSVLFYDEQTKFPGLAAAPPCLGTALVIFSNAEKPSFVGRVLAFKPLVFVGIISYSLYLWHWPVLVYAKWFTLEEPDAATRAILLLATATLAILSWKYVEVPFRSRNILPGQNSVFVFAGATALSLLFIGGFVYLNHGVVSRLSGRALGYANSRNHRPFSRDVSLDEARQGKFVELGSQRTTDPIFIMIWGDSHAMALAPVVDELCNQFSRRGILAAHAANPPVAGYAATSHHSLHEQSVAFSNLILEFIAKNHVKNVILTSYWSGYPATDLFNDQILNTVRAIVASGAKVYVLRDVPTQRSDLSRITAIATMRGFDLSAFGISRSEYEIANRAFAHTFSQLSEMGITVFDPTEYFLTQNGLLGFAKDDRVLYTDGHHLSSEGARILSPLFEPIFRL